MAGKPTYEAYFEWLMAQTQERPTVRTYRDICRIMFETEFVWLVANDDNRLQDGLDLRQQFRPGWQPSAPVSFLEVLIGLSKRLAFQAEGSASGWAWQLMRNLELERFHDPLGTRRQSRAREILEAVIYRNYQPDGQGGFFPLSWPEEDQTKIEIWSQMGAYVNEIHPDY